VSGPDPSDDEGVSLGLAVVSGAIAAAMVFPLLWLFVRVRDIELPRALELLFSPRTADILLNSLLLMGLVTGSLSARRPARVLTVRDEPPVPGGSGRSSWRCRW
jgi:hypothetical protein